jgi:Zn-dependent protease with chaperone function
MNEADNIFTGGAYEGDDDSVATMGSITVFQFSLKFESESFALDFPTQALHVELDSDSRVIFTHPKYSNWKIYSIDPAIINHRSLQRFGLKKRLEELQFEHGGPSKHAVRVYSVLGGLVACFVCLWLFSDAILGLVVNVMPADWEVKVGNAAFAEIKDEIEITKEPALTNRLNLVAQRLKKGLPFDAPKFEFHVADEPILNAFALPNGKVIVMRGLLEETDGDELAGVLAHEMSHVIRKHGMRAIAQMIGPSLISKYIFGGGSALAAMTERSALLGGLQYSRENERQADSQAWEILLRANIDPRSLTKFFRQMRRSEGGDGASADVFSTHPATSERIQLLEKKWVETKKKSGFQTVNAGPPISKTERPAPTFPFLK